MFLAVFDHLDCLVSLVSLVVLCVFGCFCVSGVVVGGSVGIALGVVVGDWSKLSKWSKSTVLTVLTVLGVFSCFWVFWGSVEGYLTMGMYWFWGVFGCF